MSGFTLLEVLVSAVVLAILVSAVYGVLNTGNIMYYDDLGLLGLQQNTRQGLEWMIDDLREAGNIEVTALDSDSDRIVFNSYKGSGLRYYRDISDSNADGIVDQVIRQDSSGLRRVVAGDIARLKFSHNSPYLTIEIRADKIVRQRPLSILLKENVALRNE